MKSPRRGVSASALPVSLQVPSLLSGSEVSTRPRSRTRTRRSNKTIHSGINNKASSENKDKFKSHGVGVTTKSTLRGLAEITLRYTCHTAGRHHRENRTIAAWRTQENMDIHRTYQPKARTNYSEERGVSIEGVPPTIVLSSLAHVVYVSSSVRTPCSASHVCAVARWHPSPSPRSSWPWTLTGSRQLCQVYHVTRGFL